MKTFTELSRSAEPTTPAGWRCLQWLDRVAVASILVTVLAIGPAARSDVAPTRQFTPLPVVVTGQITYMTDTVTAATCSTTTADLHYKVLHPVLRPGVTYPVVFGFWGAGFKSVSQCRNGQGTWESMDEPLTEWASRGFVAVNVEYHGYDNGLFGDSTCPTACAQPWGNVADASTERNAKVAITWFFDHDPGAFGADESKGIMLVGASAGGHLAYMLAVTGSIGPHRIWGAIGLSGMGDPALGGTYAIQNFGAYMETIDPVSDRFLFSSPAARITSASPAIYIANSQGEFMDPRSASSFYDRCTAVGVSLCYLRLVDAGTSHSVGYDDYRFRGLADPMEVTYPPAARGMTVLSDSICFAKRVLLIPGPACPA